MTSDMQGMMWGEPELSGLLAWDDAVVPQPVAKLGNLCDVKVSCAPM